MSAPEIAEPLHHELVTVRRWIARHTRDSIAGLPDRPRGERPRLGSPWLGLPELERRALGHVEGVRR